MAYPFSDQSVGESQWNAAAKWFLGSGVRKDELNEMEGFGDSSGLQVKVRTGRFWGYAQFVENPAEQTLALATADATNPRIDRIVLRVDWAGNLAELDILTGTPAGSPTPPSLSRTGTIWEYSLAKVAVAANATVINSGNVTDERSQPDVCGYAYSAFPAQIVTSGTHPSTFDVGGFIYESDTSKLFVNVGTAVAPSFTQLATGAAGAPADAHYVTTQAEGGLSAEQVLGTAVILKGLISGRPAASLSGRLYFASDDNGGTLYRDNGATWDQIASSITGSGAPTGASYVTTVSEAGLSNEQVLGTAVVMADVAANRPVAALNGRLYLATDTNGGTLYRDTGAAWVQVAAAVNGTGAPTTASYVTTAPEAGLSNEQVLGTAVNMAGTLASRPAAATAGRLYFATDTGVLYRDAGAAWAQVAPAIASGRSSFVIIKAGAESRNSNTMANDAHLFFAVGAGENWTGRIILAVQTLSVAADMLVNLTCPAGGELAWSLLGGLSGQTANIIPFQPFQSWQGKFPGTGVTGGAYVTRIPQSSYPLVPVWVEFVYVGVAAPAGQVRLQWAQGSTDGANPTTLGMGSYLQAWKAD